MKIVLRVEAETGTTLTESGEVKALSPADWRRKRWCEYDAIRHDLKRLTESEWAESQRRRSGVQEDAKTQP